ncbi:MAG: phosphatase PAP2 family protein [Syntrophothermus sp.]
MKPRLQEQPLRGNRLQGLHSPELSARLAIVGLMMFLLGSLAAGVLAYQVQTSETFLHWDMAVARMFRAMQINAPWSWMENILFGYFLGKEVVVLIGAIVVLYLLHRRFWRALALVAIGLGGGALIGYVLSHYFDRPRPTDHLDLLMLSGSSFPAIPVMMAVLCYGLLAYLLVPNLTSRLWKGLVLLVCILAIAMAALSSLLFGTHYASDVIAGLALGFAWFGLLFILAGKGFQPEQASRDQQHAQRTAARQGLRVPGLFQRQPIGGLTLILLSSLFFAILAYNILVQGPLMNLDLNVYKGLLARARTASPLVNDLMLFGFFVGKQAVQLIVLGLSFYFLWQRYWLELAILQVSTQGGGLIKNFIMEHISRPRPPEQMGMVITTLSSFPSGHTLGTMICYGFLAYLLVPRMPSPFWKWMLGIGLLLLILFEGLSRIFYGNHYLTDVLAGYLLGIAWLVLVCTLLESIFKKSAESSE